METLSRKEKILKLIVEEFIKSGQPVGSSTLIDIYDLPYSSATIRNEMASLEEEGLLEKTHTSSGRVPSSKGYRYYVEHLRDEVLDSNLKYQLQSLFDVSKEIQIKDAISKASEIISELTNLTSVVLGPKSNNECIQKINIVSLSTNSAVAIIVTDRGHVESKNFEISDKITFNDLETVVNIINDRIVGTPINEVIDKVDAIKPLLAEKVQNFEIIFKAFVEAFLKFTYDHVEIHGRENLLQHKEFTNDIEKLKKFVNILEQDDIWRQLANNEGVKIQIGRENSLVELDDKTIITAEIKVDDNDSGTLALIGPTRMDYDRALAAIEYVQLKLNELFSKKGDK